MKTQLIPGDKIRYNIDFFLQVGNFTTVYVVIILPSGKIHITYCVVVNSLERM